MTQAQEIETVATLVQRAITQQQQIEDLEARLSEAKQNLKTTMERDLPDAFTQAGMASFTTQDGRKVTVQPYIDCSIPAAMKNDAFVWLESNGHAELIKTEVSVQFGRGELEAAQRLAENVGGKLERSVHPQTLKKFARELYEAGETLPDYFSVYTGTRATIK